MTANDCRPFVGYQDVFEHPVVNTRSMLHLKRRSAALGHRRVYCTSSHPRISFSFSQHIRPVSRAPRLHGLSAVWRNRVIYRQSLVRARNRFLEKQVAFIRNVGAHQPPSWAAASRQLSRRILFQRACRDSFEQFGGLHPSQGFGRLL